MEVGEIRFQQLFMRSTSLLQDADVLHLSDYMVALKAWDSRNMKVLSAKDKATHYTLQKKAKGKRSKRSIDS